MRRVTRSAGALPGGPQLVELQSPKTKKRRVQQQAPQQQVPPEQTQTPPPPPPPEQTQTQTPPEQTQQQQQPPPQQQAQQQPPPPPEQQQQTTHQKTPEQTTPPTPPEQTQQQAQQQVPPPTPPTPPEQTQQQQPQQQQPVLTPVNGAELSRLPSYAEKKALFETGVVQVGNESFAVATVDRVALLKLSKFKAAFQGAGSSGDAPAPGKKHESFVDRWLRDPDRRIATKLTYIPRAPHSEMPPPPPVRGEINTFLGFDAAVTTRANLAPLRIAALVKPWRALGIQLCEGFDAKFDLLEQWLAHMVQLPHERSNIAFGIVGAREGVGKNAFFAPVRKVLGPHNAFESADIHKFVESFHEKADMAGRLLCIHDEANPKSTKLFHDKLKVTVTGETAWSRHAGEVPHELPAHHRFVALSNNLDGLYVDFKSGNRRFVLLKPTKVFATPQPGRDLPEDLLTPEARLTHRKEYTRRFVNPGADECISALYQHLATLKLKYHDTTEWEEAATKLMSASPLSTSIEPTPGHVEFLYSITREPEDPQRPPIEGDKKSGLRNVKQVGWKKTDAHDDDYDEDRRDDPSYNLNRPYHEIEISREALFKLFSGTRYAESGSSQHKFSLDVQTIFARAASIETYGSHMVTPTGLDHDFKTDGVRYWRFSTQRLRAQLERDHPALKLLRAPDAALSLSDAITSGAMYLDLA
jgi:hypothetical protein